MDLQLENLALRHQLGVLQRSVKRPKLSESDGAFWVALARFWPAWRSALTIVKPETVIGWHRKAFRLFWTWKSRRRRIGRPRISAKVRELIREMAGANPLWGAPRIHGELEKIGIQVSQASVAKYMPKHRKPPSQGWRTFVKNHASQLASIDFFVVPTVTFRLLYVFIVLAHERRQIVHFNVTAHPTSEWTSNQLIQAFPWDSSPRYLLRDRDGIYGTAVRQQIQVLGIQEVLSAALAPWQRAYVERVIGSIRRECLDHVITFNEAGLYRTIKSYVSYYHRSRTHLSLNKDAPEGRAIEHRDKGPVVSIAEVGGLHHRYERAA